MGLEGHGQMRTYSNDNVINKRKLKHKLMTEGRRTYKMFASSFPVPRGCWVGDTQRECRHSASTPGGPLHGVTALKVSILRAKGLELAAARALCSTGSSAPHLSVTLQ